MDITKLFSVANTLFKFLCYGGIAMVFVAMFYPLQREQNIEIEINSFNREAELINSEIKILKEQVKIIEKQTPQIISRLDSLSKLKSKSKNPKKIKELKVKIQKIQASYNNKLDKIKESTSEISEKTISSKYNKLKIEILESHAKSYSSYSKLLFRSGFVMAIIGLISWIYSTWNTERLKIQEIQKNELTHQEMPKPVLLTDNSERTVEKGKAEEKEEKT
jgi:ABC-type anion transport system duplicated permease subunit